jgi:hypothetical protein
MLDRYTLNTFMVDTLYSNDSNGDVIDPYVVMHIWKQNRVLIMADIIRDIADYAGGTTKVREDDYLNITYDVWDEYLFQWKLKMNTKSNGIQNVTSSSNNNNNYMNNNSIIKNYRLLFGALKRIEHNTRY